MAVSAALEATFWTRVLLSWGESFVWHPQCHLGRVWLIVELTILTGELLRCVWAATLWQELPLWSRRRWNWLEADGMCIGGCDGSGGLYTLFETCSHDIEGLAMWYYMIRPNFSESKKTDSLSGSHPKINIKSTMKAKCLLLGTTKDVIPIFVTIILHGFSFVSWALIWHTSKIWPFVNWFFLVTV